MSAIDLTVTGPEFLEILRSKDLKKPRVFYDIETGPAADAVLRVMYDESKVKLPKHPGQFDPTKIKYGNMGEAKRKEKYAAKFQEHQQLCASFDADCAAARQEHWDEFVSQAPLHAETAEVLAVGYGIETSDGLQVCLDITEGHEADLLIHFWQIAEIVRNRAGNLISFNGNRFDIPVLTRRSWVQDVDCLYLRTKYNKMEDWCVDALDHWRMGGSWNDNIKLSKVATLLGTTSKLEGMTGDQFWEVLKTDRRKAREYLYFDILSLAGVAKRFKIA